MGGNLGNVVGIQELFSPLFIWLTVLIMKTKTKRSETTHMSIGRGFGSIMVGPQAARKKNEAYLCQ